MTGGNLLVRNLILQEYGWRESKLVGILLVGICTVGIFWREFKLAVKLKHTFFRVVLTEQTRMLSAMQPECKSGWLFPG